MELRLPVNNSRIPLTILGIVKPRRLAVIKPGAT
jgi:hypothetical protein